jgi:outer membrane protein OmpU
MKRFILTTTALAATCLGGAAYAQIELTGSAELGLFYSGAPGANENFEFHSDIDVRFTFSGATDNGLTFGASIDLDEEGGFAATNGGPEEIFLSGNFGTITMGDTDGAFDWALQELALGAGSIADDETAHLGYYGNDGLDGFYDGQIARYDYSFGDFAFAVSVELDDTGLGDPVFGIGGRYSGTLGGLDLNVGLGYQRADFTGGDVDIAGASVDVEDEHWRIGINYSLENFTIGLATTEVERYGAGASYNTGAITVGVNYGVVDFDSVFETSGFGVTAGYDLGGGAELLFGYGHSTIRAGGIENSYHQTSFGLSFSF